MLRRTPNGSLPSFFESPPFCESALDTADTVGASARYCYYYYYYYVYYYYCY